MPRFFQDGPDFSDWTKATRYVIRVNGEIIDIREKLGKQSKWFRWCLRSAREMGGELLVGRGDNLSRYRVLR